MALTGLNIFKLLPKTNCGECGVPTCMAFAMKLAAKNAELSACPYASDEAKKTIGAASKPPIRLVKIGPAGAEVAVGNETVMFRHEKTFVHQTAIAASFSDMQSLEELRHRTAEVREYCLERVGEKLRIDLALVENTFYWREAMPFVSPNLGPDQYGAWFGAELHFAPGSEHTNWIEPPKPGCIANSIIGRPGSHQHRRRQVIAHIFEVPLRERPAHAMPHDDRPAR